MDLIFGKKDLTRIISILLPGFILAILVLVLQGINNFSDIILIIFSVDIGAGIASNLTKETQKAWAKVNLIYISLFIVIHTFLYPLLIILLTINNSVRIILITLLVLKTYLFINGNRKRLLKF